MTTVQGKEPDTTDGRGARILERDALGRITKRGDVPRRPRECPTCGTVFDPGYGGGSRAYCSDGCKQRYRVDWPAPIELDLTWQEQGACQGMDVAMFFPERGDPTDQARAVCRACPVQVDCLNYALAAREVFGMWGGTSERERRQMRRRRNTGREVA